MDLSFVQKLSQSPTFDFITCLLILSNAIAMGMQADYMARHWSRTVPVALEVAEILFCALFILELSVRICASEPSFFRSPGFWDVLDCIVVGLQIQDCVSWAVWGRRGELSCINILRLVRFLRIVHKARIAGVWQNVAGLRMLLVSIGDSLQSLGWVVFIITLQTFVFGVFLTQYVTDHKLLLGRDRMEEQWELEEIYGTLDRSMLALYEILSDGIHWSEIMDPLTQHCSPWLAIAFVVYVAFTVVASMNVVLGVFVGSALNAAEDERQDILLQQMGQLFLDLDQDGSGSISEEEFMHHMSSPQMVRFLKGIDLSPDDAKQLFAILDTDASGELEADELVSGCLRLHGAAKALDLAAFMTEYGQATTRTEKALESLSDGICDIMGQLGGIRDTANGFAATGSALGQESAPVSSFVSAV